MDVGIHWRDITRSHHVEDYLALRVRFEVGQLADRVTGVHARLQDVKGDGVDKHCAIEIEGTFGRLYASACGSDLYAAVDKAAKAIGALVSDKRPRERA